jgi:RimJ/RimL family protein N-acetyltransferase
VARYANNRKIWINLTDRFPHPYTDADAEGWLGSHAESDEIIFAIDVQGEAVGSIGLTPQQDLQVRVAEIGYWLGEPYWGRGLATDAVRRVTAWAFAQREFERIFAAVLEWNPASARVLEKAGYELEARQRRNIYKDGKVVDSLLYVSLRPDR